MSAQCSAQVLSGQWGYLTDRIFCPCECCRTTPTASEMKTFLPGVIIKSVDKMLFAEFCCYLVREKMTVVWFFPFLSWQALPDTVCIWNLVAPLLLGLAVWGANLECAGLENGELFFTCLEEILNSINTCRIAFVAGVGIIILGKNSNFKWYVIDLSLLSLWGANNLPCVLCLVPEAHAEGELKPSFALFVLGGTVGARAVWNTMKGLLQSVIFQSTCLLGVGFSSTRAMHKGLNP